MDQLRILWNLENDINLLKEKEGILESLKLNTEGIKRRKTISNLKDDIEELEDLYESINKEIHKKELKIKEIEYNIKKNDDELYGGSISDIKQLEFLSEQKLELKELLDNSEIDALKLYDRKDLLEEKISIGKKNLNENEKNDEALNHKNISEIEMLKVNIEDLSKKIEQEKTLLDKGILNDYLKIKRRKKKAVALAEDSTCRGCNMKLSSGMWDDIKHSKEPILCDSCGRILYYNHKENN